MVSVIPVVSTFDVGFGVLVVVSAGVGEAAYTGVATSDSIVEAGRLLLDVPELDIDCPEGVEDVEPRAVTVGVGEPVPFTGYLVI